MDILTESDELLDKLIARLPELEWKISGLGPLFSTQSLPKGLFRLVDGASGVACIAEIKADIYALSQQKSEYSALYLAERIRQKVNVLVVLCQIRNQKNKPEEKAYFGVKMLSTRQRWIYDLEAEVNTLVEQQQALLQALDHLRYKNHADAILHLKSELGELERRLTLAKEALDYSLMLK